MNKRTFFEMPEELRCKAIDLTPRWMAEWGYAWDRYTILQVFEWARQRSLAILGGDIYSLLQDPGDIYYPGFWMEFSNIQEDWDLFVELSYQNAVSFVQNTPYLAQSGLIIEPTIWTELDFLKLYSDENESKAKKLYLEELKEVEQRVVIDVLKATRLLLYLRDAIYRCLNGQVGFDAFITEVRALIYIPETDQNMVYAERLRRELLEYALGTLLGLTSEGTEDHKKQTLEHLLRYLNGEEPFLGEKICL